MNTLLARLEEIKGIGFKVYEQSGSIRTIEIDSANGCVVGDCPIVALAKLRVALNPELLTDYRKALLKASNLLSQEITASPAGWRNADALVLGTVLLQCDPKEVMEVITAADAVGGDLRNELMTALGLN